MKDIIIATNNKHKTIEYKAMLHKLGYNVLSLSDIDFDQEIIESSDTFHGNALIKAKTISDYTKKMVIADDTGLCVNKLGGDPGVYSARYAGISHDYQRNNEKLLKKLDGIIDRSAYFITVICLYIPFQEAIFFEGRLDGEIALEAKGGNGFGYDPLFVLKNGKHLAELSLDEKNKISHRALALQKLTKYLSDNKI